jgi:hypothetical protein
MLVNSASARNRSIEVLARLSLSLIARALVIGVGKVETSTLRNVPEPGYSEVGLHGKLIDVRSYAHLLAYCFRATRHFLHLISW